MGNLIPSYTFSFSSLLPKILLFRETDILSIVVPKRIVNCWGGFGLSSCARRITRERVRREAFMDNGQRTHDNVFYDVHVKPRVLNRVMLRGFTLTKCVWKLFCTPLLAIWGRMLSVCWCWFLALLTITWTTGGSSWGREPTLGPNFCKAQNLEKN